MAKRKQAEPEPQEPAHRPPMALHLLHRANQAAAAAFRCQGMPHDLTPRQYTVLAAVAEARGGPLSQTDITATTGVDRSCLAEVVGRLVQKGLIQRRRVKDDRRAYAVSLTEQGSAVIAACTRPVATAEEELLDPLGADERRVLMASLQRLAEHAAAGSGEAAHPGP